VLMIHTNIYMVSEELINFKIFYGALSRCAVPLFMMASGALLYRRKPTPKKTFKMVLKLVFLIIFFNFVYRYWDGWWMNDTSMENLMKFNEKFHLYYLYIAVVLFISAPVVYRLVSNMTRNEYRFAIFLFFLGSIVVPHLKTLNLIKNPFILTYSLSMSYSTIGYAMIGHYIFKYKEDIPRGFSIFGAFAIWYMIDILMKNPTDANFVTYFEMVNPLSFIYAVSVFLFVVKSKTDTELSLLSNSTLFIYTTHILVLEYFLKVGLIPEAFKDFKVMYPIIMSLMIIVLELIPYSIYNIVKKKIK
ncbi:MAG: acyltransferase family protein, partial [Peptoniphilus sp.]|uniref:acyltransferase n=1 Tax=Peptoniphilus sp. TaxID=1971214 RepID=UPI002A762370